MNILLLAENPTSNTGGSGATWWILLALLAVLVIAYIFSFVRRKKYNQQTSSMLNNLKPGDKIKTYSGFYGTVLSIRETTDGKVITLETGEGSKKSYLTVDQNAVYSIDKKEDIVYDAEGNVVIPESLKDNKELQKEAEKVKALKAEEAQTVEAEISETEDSTETEFDSDNAEEDAPKKPKRNRKK